MFLETDEVDERESDVLREFFVRVFKNETRQK